MGTLDKMKLSRLGDCIVLLFTALFAAVLLNSILVSAKLGDLLSNAASDQPSPNIAIIHLVANVVMMVLIFHAIMRVAFYKKSPFISHIYGSYLATVLLVVFMVAELTIYHLPLPLDGILMATTIIAFLMTAATGVILFVARCHSWTLFDKNWEIGNDPTTSGTDKFYIRPNAVDNTQSSQDDASV